MTVNFNDFVEETAEPVEAVIDFIPQTGLYRNFGKRILDVVVVGATLFFTLPVILILAFFVSLDGSAPFFRQKRVGKGGALFSMWKLRSMVPNAEEHLHAYLEANPDAKREWDSTQKLKDDPRITKLGLFIRKTSLDELPQLFNVLLGEMSLIGPRPMMCDQEDLYPGKAYYRLKPGISGPWQVSERNASEFKSRAIFDLRYDLNLSLKTDVKVIWKTFGVVLRGTGY
ncbi:sugar transferase [Roseobacter sp. N2S]|uniref:sugar transferase n=1 Tax=Roseobacter sp. N2S TaxID=2663844 RepID=UPI00286072B5|nr:sugar transferase [Roseobacter sp. N2S]MDR6267665.1 lipopolysaccharide/colanic/teichoic acid biosynthesis glycosyltransferase [Roseobacter sp. N2S]